MADVKVISTGKEFYKLDSGIVALLREMFPAALGPVDPPAPAPLQPPVPLWGVTKNAFNEQYHIALKLNRETVLYDGEPKHAAAYFKQLKGLDVPVGIVAEYALLRGKPVPRVSRQETWQ
ncbi:MAG: hypothetical protein ACE14M_11010 [Terriglobales bacterium]